MSWVLLVWRFRILYHPKMGPYRAREPCKMPDLKTFFIFAFLLLVITNEFWVLIKKIGISNSIASLCENSVKPWAFFFFFSYKVLSLSFDSSFLWTLLNSWNFLQWDCWDTLNQWITHSKCPKWAYNAFFTSNCWTSNWALGTTDGNCLHWKIGLDFLLNECSLSNKPLR